MSNIITEIAMKSAAADTYIFLYFPEYHDNNPYNYQKYISQLKVYLWNGLLTSIYRSNF